MAINTTWSVSDMTHMDSDGGVILVRWSCTAKSDVSPFYTAVESGKLSCTYDASSPDFIAYANLTEADVLGWVYPSLVEGDETPEEAKLRVETDRIAKVQGQIDKAATEENGVPWSTDESPIE